MEARAYWRKKDGVWIVLTEEHVYAFTLARLLGKLSLQLEYQLDCDPESVVRFLSSFTEIKKEKNIIRIFSLLGKYL